MSLAVAFFELLSATARAEIVAADVGELRILVGVGRRVLLQRHGGSRNYLHNIAANPGVGGALHIVEQNPALAPVLDGRIPLAVRPDFQRLGQ